MENTEKLKAIRTELERISQAHGNPEAAVIDIKLVRYVALKLGVDQPTRPKVGPAPPSPDVRPSWSY